MAKKSVSKKKVCFECTLPISEKESTYVLLGTYFRTAKPDDEVFYHFPCWVDHFNKAVNKKAEAICGEVNNSLNVLDILKDLEMIKGGLGLLRKLDIKHIIKRRTKKRVDKRKYPNHVRKKPVKKVIKKKDNGKRKQKAKKKN